MLIAFKKWAAAGALALAAAMVLVPAPAEAGVFRRRSGELRRPARAVVALIANGRERRADRRDRRIDRRGAWSFSRGGCCD